MDIKSLGYLGIRSEDPKRWERFGTEILGMRAISEGDGLVHLRMDDRHHRITIEQGSPDDGAYYGWEVPDAGALATAAAELDAAGVAVKEGTAQDLEQRRVAGLLAVDDPAGHRVELYHGLAEGDGAFTPTRDIGAFVTGDQGFGHCVLMVPEIESAQSFYTDTLGLRLSDFMRQPFNAAFLHANRRHHSLALLETGVSAMHHFMVEVDNLNDVGRTYDLVQAEGIEIAATLGRHSNDHMFSFYMRSPSGFQIEYGWGGRSVDDATWEVTELTAGPSLWGHAGIG